MTQNKQVRPTKIVHPENEKSQQVILDAAMELIVLKGVQNTTIEAIAKRAGVGRETIYRYWPSKGILIAEVFRQFYYELVIMLL